MPVFRSGDLRYTQLKGRLAANPFPEGVAKDVSMRVVRIPPGPRTPHRHPHSCEVMFVVQGRGQIWEGDQVHPVEAGDVVLLPTGVPHATVSAGHEEVVLACFFPHQDLAGNTEELAEPVRY